VHAGDKPQARAAVDEAMTFSMALTLPAAAALVSMPFFLIDGLYTRGAFRAFDAHVTAQALQQYGWGVPAFVLAQIASRAFFAQQDTATPMRCALASVAANIALGVTLFYLVGVAGIAAATSAAAWLNVVMMTVILARRGIYAPSAKAWSHLARVLAASVALGLILATASHFRGLLEAPFVHVRLGPLHAKEIVILGLTVMAGLIYPVLLVASGGLTPADIRAALRRSPAAGPADEPLTLP
jgi:putative peptidoglycan lipid II flippase